MKTKQTRVRKVPIKSIDVNKQFTATHSNFAEEIYQKEKANKFFDRITAILSVVAIVLLATLIIVNIK